MRLAIPARAFEFSPRPQAAPHPEPRGRAAPAAGCPGAHPRQRRAFAHGRHRRPGREPVEGGERLGVGLGHWEAQNRFFALRQRREDLRELLLAARPGPRVRSHDGARARTPFKHHGTSRPDADGRHRERGAGRRRRALPRQVRGGPGRAGDRPTSSRKVTTCWSPGSGIAAPERRIGAKLPCSTWTTIAGRAPSRSSGTGATSSSSRRWRIPSSRGWPTSPSGSMPEGTWPASSSRDAA